MKATEDAHGQVIWKYYNKERSFDVVERDDGYVNVDEGAGGKLPKPGPRQRGDEQHECRDKRSYRYIILPVGQLCILDELPL
jgi:hypothetical protein